MYENHVLPAIEALRYNDEAKVLSFRDSDMGQRIQASVTLERFFDANIVGALQANTDESKAQTALLRKLTKKGQSTSTRYY